LVIASDNDKSTTLPTLDLLRQKSAGTKTQIMLYKGSDHGLPLFDLDTTLPTRIINWLKAE
jgi:hypothetical protein